jgi:hypothetical protein
VKTIIGLVIGTVWFALAGLQAKAAEAQFRVLAFYTGVEEPAHVSFVREANVWFPALARKHQFAYEATTNWSRLNATTLADHQVVLFLDTRPESPEQRAAFRRYMEHGGAWMGFHFAGFALNNSKYPSNWDWYHHEFLGSGSYRSNTWRPTSAVLRVEDARHPATRGLPATFRSAPNEWYRWEDDLRSNPAIKVLLSIDPTSFPLGTGPKPEEIWHGGDYPVVWTNTRYRMIYFNMGHNDLDFERKTNPELSFTFGNKIQDELIANSLLWLGSQEKAGPPN